MDSENYFSYNFLRATINERKTNSGRHEASLCCQGSVRTCKDELCGEGDALLDGFVRTNLLQHKMMTRDVKPTSGSSHGRIFFAVTAFASGRLLTEASFWSLLDWCCRHSIEFEACPPRGPLRRYSPVPPNLGDNQVRGTLGQTCRGKTAPHLRWDFCPTHLHQKCRQML